MLVAGWTIITPDGWTVEDGLWWSGWMLSLASAITAVAGGSQFKDSCIEGEGWILGELVPKLNIILNTHTKNEVNIPVFVLTFSKIWLPRTWEKSFRTRGSHLTKSQCLMACSIEVAEDGHIASFEHNLKHHVSGMDVLGLLFPFLPTEVVEDRRMASFAQILKHHCCWSYWWWMDVWGLHQEWSSLSDPVSAWLSVAQNIGLVLQS